MKKAIEKYNKADKALKAAKEELDIEVTKFFKNNPYQSMSIQELQDFVETLPRWYPGARHVYEMMERKGDKE